jgi:hypothetical protein
VGARKGREVVREAGELEARAEGRSCVREREEEDGSCVWLTTFRVVL